MSLPSWWREALWRVVSLPSWWREALWRVVSLPSWWREVLWRVVSLLSWRREVFIRVSLCCCRMHYFFLLCFHWNPHGLNPSFIPLVADLCHCRLVIFITWGTISTQSLRRRKGLPIYIIVHYSASLLWRLLSSLSLLLPLLLIAAR